MNGSRKVNVRKNLIAGILNKMVGTLSPFIVRSIIIYMLGEQFLGLSSLFESILQVLNLAELGFTSAVVFSLYKPFSENDEDAICALLFFYRKIYRIIGLIILVAGILVMPFVPYIIKGGYPNTINIYVLYFLYLANTVISYLLFSYKRVLLTADQKVGVLNNINTTISVLRCIAQFVVLYFWKNYYAFFLCVIMATIIDNLAVAYITKKKFPQYVCRGLIDSDTKQSIKQQVFGLSINKVCTTTRNSFDNIFLSAFCGLIDVAIYSNYFLVHQALLNFFNMAKEAFVASVGNSIVERSAERNYADFKKINVAFIFFVDFSTICLVCLYSPFMKIWTKNKLVADEMIPFLFGTYFFILGAGIVRSLYQSARGVWWNLRWFSVGEAVCNVSLNAVLGKLFGMTGILIATIISVSVFSFGFNGHQLFKEYFKTGEKEYFLEILLHGVMSLLIAYVINRIPILSGNIWQEFFIKAVVSFLSAIVILSAVIVIVPRYRGYLKSIIGIKSIFKYENDL